MSEEEVKTPIDVKVVGLSEQRLGFMLFLIIVLLGMFVFDFVGLQKSFEALQKKTRDYQNAMINLTAQNNDRNCIEYHHSKCMSLSRAMQADANETRFYPPEVCRGFAGSLCLCEKYRSLKDWLQLDDAIGDAFKSACEGREMYKEGTAERVAEIRVHASQKLYKERLKKYSIFIDCNPLKKWSDNAK